MSADRHMPQGAAGYSDANRYRPRNGAKSERVGRRTKFTEAELASALRRGAGVFAEACRILAATHGRTIAISTLGRAVNSSPRLQQVLSETMESRLDYAESALWKRIEMGCPKAIEFYLKCKGTDRGWRTTVRHTGDAENPVHTEVTFNFDSVPVDQLRAMQETLEAARRRAVNEAGTDPDAEDGGDPLPAPPPLTSHKIDDAQRDTFQHPNDFGPR